jgi:hypothetical protein
MGIQVHARAGPFPRMPQFSVAQHQISSRSEATSDIRLTVQEMGPETTANGAISATHLWRVWKNKRCRRGMTEIGTCKFLGGTPLTAKRIFKCEIVKTLTVIYVGQEHSLYSMALLQEKRGVDEVNTGVSLPSGANFFQI